MLVNFATNSRRKHTPSTSHPFFRHSDAIMAPQKSETTCTENWELDLVIDLECSWSKLVGRILTSWGPAKLEREASSKGDTRQMGVASEGQKSSLMNKLSNKSTGERKSASNGCESISNGRLQKTVLRQKRSETRKNSLIRTAWFRKEFLEYSVISKPYLLSF